jgi:hypothetical protein
MNSKFQMTSILFSLLLIQPLLSSGSFAYARRKAVMRAYSFITTDGKASQGECDGEVKVPRKLKRQKEMAKSASYMGSELLDPEIKVNEKEELWKHFFKNKPACNAVLAKAPSSLEEAQKQNKPELPPEESTETPADEEKGSPPDPE